MKINQMEYRKNNLFIVLLLFFYNYLNYFQSRRINNSQIPFEIYEAAYEEEPEEERS